MSQKLINICTVRGWILRKLAMMITAKHQTIHNVSMPQPYVAFYGAPNLYIDVWNTYRNYKEYGSSHVGLMTHNIDMTPDFWQKLHEEHKWKDLDGIIVLGKRYEKILREEGYEGELISLVPGNFGHAFHAAPVKLLIAQRGEGLHYGKEFLRDLVDTYPHTMMQCEFTFLGDGWEDMVKTLEENGILAEHWKDSELDTSYPKAYQDWYGWCDYLFIPIMETAGPMCLPEALACGKPVICGDVGWAGYEFHPDFMFTPGNVDEAASILKKIVQERAERRKRVVNEKVDFSWETYATDVINFVAAVDDKVIAEGK
jgi:glycosyltransferase involved in cell wall biosynthesis